MAKKDRYIIGLDIGTTKTSTIIGEINEEGGLEVIGIGTSQSKGMRRGAIVNLDKTVESIRESVQEAELMAGVDVDKVYVGINGSHVRGFNGTGVIAISNRDKEITQSDVDRAIDAAKSMGFPGDKDIFHVLPQEFKVDDQEGIGNPIGMSGSRLEVNVHIVTGSKTAAQNVETCVNRAGIEVMDIVLEQLASSESVLTDDEKELGVALIEVGGGTTDLAIFEKGSIRHISVLPTGGEHFTSDIAVGLRTPMNEAEKIKKKYGCALTSLIDENDTIEVPGVGGRKPRILSKKLLGDIIQPRAEEIFNLVNEEIIRAGYEKVLNSGIVLTGGGASMDGMCEIAEQIFDLQVRRGTPKEIGGLKDVIGSPAFSTAVGLILYGYKNHDMRKKDAGSCFAKLGSRVKEWLSEFL